MAYFPLFISLEGKQCLIVGGGRVAFRKAKVMLEYGAKLRVIAEELCPEMQEFLETKGIAAEKYHAYTDQDKREGEVPATFFCRKAVAGDAEGMDLVICASSDRKLHQEISAYCQKYRIPVNVADNQEESTFLFPALVRQEDVVVGITTGGNSPAASRFLREYISGQIPEGMGKLVQRMGSMRGLVKNAFPGQKLREEVFTRLFFLGMERNGELWEEDVLRVIREVIGEQTI